MSHILFHVAVDLKKIKNFSIKVIHITVIVRSPFPCSVLCSFVNNYAIWAQLNRFHLKVKIEYGLRNICFKEKKGDE
jgi:hypothetical protein